MLCISLARWSSSVATWALWAAAALFSSVINAFNLQGHVVGSRPLHAGVNLARSAMTREPG